jgi:hyperosmotically inducible protein
MNARSGRILSLYLIHRKEYHRLADRSWKCKWQLGMNCLTFSKATASVVLLGTIWMTQLPADQSDAQTKPDNSAVNKRDKASGAVTADQQKMNAADRDLTAKIRKAVIADRSLSTYAHNVKIISQDGTVTLKGPVRSDDEVKSLVAKATDATGSADKVINQLSVQPASK